MLLKRKICFKDKVKIFWSMYLPIVKIFEIHFFYNSFGFIFLSAASLNLESSELLTVKKVYFFISDDLGLRNNSLNK